MDDYKTFILCRWAIFAVLAAVVIYVDGANTLLVLAWAAGVFMPTGHMAEIMFGGNEDGRPGKDNSKKK